MADSIIRLRVDSQEYDNKLKRAAQGLQQYIDGCRKVGGTLEVVEQETLDYIKAIGNMSTTSRSAKGALSEMTKAFVDLSMEYKQFTDQEKAAPAGKAMAASLDTLRGKIQQTKKDLEEINNSLNGTGVSGGGLFGGDKLSGMLQVFGGNVMTKVAGVGVGLVSELGEAVKQGIELAKQGEGIRIAFERLGRGDILQGLREATHGTVSDLELMKAAVQFNDFKLPLDELGTMLAFAQQKAKDTGQSVEYMTQSIVTGLGRKSLMILDNLGLSAAEIRERMKETGDMTKAVGAIIRDQMAKAGDYVETAADRALQANVSLQNKMEELGRKFAPVQEASNQLWTSIKIGILDIVGGPLARLLNGLTQAGQLRNAIADAGGSERVTNDINKLKGSNYKDKVYTAMLNRYSREEQAARNNWLKAQRGGMGSIQIWKNQYDAATALRQEFQSRGSAVVNPIPTTTTPTTPVPVEIKDPPKADEFDTSKIAFNVGEVGPNAFRDVPSVYAMLGDQGLRAMMGIGAQQFDPNKDISTRWRVNKKGQLTDKKDDDKKDTQVDILKGVETMTGSLQGIFDGINKLGIELPEELTSMLGVLQTIASIVSAIQSMESVGKFLGFIPGFANGGMVPRAANGYYVPGNNYSGDTTPVLANAGELILNRAAQASIASQLTGSNNQQQNREPYVTGDIIFLGLRNYLQANGYGDLVTTKSR